jgi:hypothetical protein
MKQSLIPCNVPLLSFASICLLSSAGLIACQTQPDRDLGDTPAHRALNTTSEPTERFGGSPLDFVGRWVGVAEEPLALGGVNDTYRFPSGSSEITLEIPDEEFEIGDLRGTLVFGSGLVPPPDPDLGFPSDVDYYRDLDYFGSGRYQGPLPPYEGFAYEVAEIFERGMTTLDDERNPIVADGVLHLGFNTSELLAPWCELQQPQPTGDGGFSCVKGIGRGTEGDLCIVGFSGLTPEEEAAVVAMGVSLDDELVDCNKRYLCNREVCECSETGCREGGGSGGQLSLRRVGDTLTGIFSGTVFVNARKLPVPLGTVRFTRAD